MSKRFNTAGLCIPQYHYMVNISDKIVQIKEMIDAGNYFTINRARQFGKTTTLEMLRVSLKEEYVVLSLSFENLGTASFSEEKIFVKDFIEVVLIPELELQEMDFSNYIDKIRVDVMMLDRELNMARLSLLLSELCRISPKPVVMMIDEVDSASNNQVFLDFLAVLRNQYLKRTRIPTFQAVILAGVYDVRNLKKKLRPEDEHKYNSPWNIAADFDVDMSFSSKEIAGMLKEYEKEHQTGMDMEQIAEQIYEYTSGYPYLVSRICKLIDERMEDGWTREGVNGAVKQILAEASTLFGDMRKKIADFPELRNMLYAILFEGKNFPYNQYEESIDVGVMFGFIKEEQGNIAVANRIFEMWMYNLFLTEDVVRSEIYQRAALHKNQFIVNGQLDMEHVLRKFVDYFVDIYAENDEKFVEHNGRKLFLLYLKPIINGSGNFYIEAQTRDMKRTDVIVDYRGEQFIIELKIWHGEEYSRRGETQIFEYLQYYRKEKGYMLSFNFNKKKEAGVKKICCQGKEIVEAVV